MASERAANFLTTLGKGLGAVAGTRIEREAKEIDYAREQSLRELEHGYRTEEIGAQAKNALALEDVQQTGANTRSANETRGANERSRLERESTERVTTDRFRRQDVDDLKTSHTQMVNRIDTRIQKISDDLREEKLAEGMPGYQDALSELDQLEQQKDSLEASFMIQMRDLGVPGYKERIDSLMPKPKAVPGSTPSGPEGPPDPGADLAHDAQAAVAPDTGAVADVAAGMPGAAESPIVVPPPPLPGPSYNSYGRKPANRKPSRYSMIDPKDQDRALGRLFREKPWLYRHSPEARKGAGLPTFEELDQLGPDQEPAELIPPSTKVSGVIDRSKMPTGR